MWRVRAARQAWGRQLCGPCVGTATCGDSHEAAAHLRLEVVDLALRMPVLRDELVVIAEQRCVSALGGAQLSAEVLTLHFTSRQGLIHLRYLGAQGGKLGSCRRTDGLQLVTRRRRILLELLARVPLQTPPRTRPSSKDPLTRVVRLRGRWVQILGEVRRTSGGRGSRRARLVANVGRPSGSTAASSAVSDAHTHQIGDGARNLQLCLAKRGPEAPSEEQHARQLGTRLRGCRGDCGRRHRRRHLARAPDRGCGRRLRSRGWGHIAGHSARRQRLVRSWCWRWRLVWRRSI